MKKYLLVFVVIMVLCSCSESKKYAGLFKNINKSALATEIYVINTLHDNYIIKSPDGKMFQQGERKGNRITVVEDSTKLLYDFDADYNKITVSSNMNQVETYIRSR